MNNKKFMGSLIILFVILLSAGNAFADNFLAFYPVASPGSTLETHTFTLGSTPYIYASLPDEDLLLWYSTVNSDWLFGATLKDTVEREGQNQLEFSFSSLNWSTIAQQGTWYVNGNFSIADQLSQITYNGSGSTSFTYGVVPEPVSMILFISGGAALAAKRSFRRRS